MARSEPTPCRSANKASTAKSKYRPVPWKRNVRKPPEQVAVWLEANPSVQPVVGCIKTIPRDQLEAGKYAHLGLGHVGGQVVIPDSRVPLGELGPYSTKNREGWEVKRDDLPMITKTFSFDVPNWGDPSNGYHTVDQEREVYQRDYYDPPLFAIRMQALKASDSAVIVKFVVDWPVDRESEDFEHDLLFALNLLHENVGACGALPADASTGDLLATLNVEWEFFPPGTAPEIESFFRGGMKKVTPEVDAIIKERAELFRKQNPQKYIRGTGGLSRYVGALFAENPVVFENVHYGNALWVLYESWAETSKRSRINLLRLRDIPFDRFVHSDGWQDRFAEHIAIEKKKRGIKDSRGSGGKAA
jgi:hypothetical protein